MTAKICKYFEGGGREGGKLGKIVTEAFNLTGKTERFVKLNCLLELD